MHFLKKPGAGGIQDRFDLITPPGKIANILTVILLIINLNLLQNSLNPILWTARRSEYDVISLYNYLSGLMRIITKDYFLNFGYWNEGVNSPREAQRRLCSLISDASNLYSAGKVLDIGSGFSVPAIYWKSLFNSLNIVCVDVNLLQLKFGVSLQDELKEKKITFSIHSSNSLIFLFLAFLVTITVTGPSSSFER